MGLLEWTPALVTRHPQIDAQHRSIIAAYNELQVAIGGGQGPAAVRRTLMFLASYTIQHFEMEAALMDREQYPGAGPHKQRHHDLVVQLRELVNGLDGGAAAITDATLAFLGTWLVEHILDEDCRLAEFLRSRPS